MRDRRGFSIAEALIALAMISIILLAVGGGMLTGTRSQSRNRDLATRDQVADLLRRSLFLSATLRDSVELSSAPGNQALGNCLDATVYTSGTCPSAGTWSGLQLHSRAVHASLPLSQELEAGALGAGLYSPRGELCSAVGLSTVTQCPIAAWTRFRTSGCSAFTAPSFPNAVCRYIEVEYRIGDSRRAGGGERDDPLSTLPAEQALSIADVQGSFIVDLVADAGSAVATTTTTTVVATTTTTSTSGATTTGATTTGPTTTGPTTSSTTTTDPSTTTTGPSTSSTTTTSDPSTTSSTTTTTLVAPPSPPVCTPPLTVC